MGIGVKGYRDVISQVTSNSGFGSSAVAMWVNSKAFERKVAPVK